MGRDQLIMRPAFDDTAMFKHHDQIGILDRGNAMRNGDDGFAAIQLTQMALDLRFGLHVHRAGGVVHDEDRRIIGQGTRQTQTLLLPA